MFVVNQNLTNPKNGRSLLASLLLLLPLQSYDPAFRKVDGTRSNKKTRKMLYTLLRIRIINLYA